MKKALIIAAALVMTFVMATAVSAAVYTDFDSWDGFTAGGNPVYNAEDAADYWTGKWSDGGTNESEHAEIVEGKGVDGSKALAVYSDINENVGLYLFGAKSGIATDYTGAAYLRVWMDLTEVGFRKANYGTINSTFSLFTTDEVDVEGLPFYYLADGTSDWVEMFHGGDGCFGDAQASDVFGFKGYFAFPVADFWVRENANWDALDSGSVAPMNDVQGIYLFWDYADYLLGGEKFYLDNIEFVADYKAFDAAPAAAPTYTYPASGEAGSIINGSVIGNAEGWGGNAAAGAAAAFDGDPATFFDPLGVGDGFCGIDAGAAYILDKAAILSRADNAPRFEGAMIQGSNDGENWTTLYTSPAAAASTTEYTVITEFENNTGYSMYRYFNETQHGDVAEVEFYGTAGTAEAPAAVETPAEAPAAETPAPAPVTTAPQTFDAIGIAVIALAASFGAAVVSKKRG